MDRPLTELWGDFIDAVRAKDIRILEIRDAIERRVAQQSRAEVRFAPLGDNHHNAYACPYCNDTRATAERRIATQARQQERELLAKEMQARIEELPIWPLDEGARQAAGGKQYGFLPRDVIRAGKDTFEAAALRDEPEPEDT